nr:MAG TPA_asm: hypothetical protein [Caudoviricetes sp.]
MANIFHSPINLNIVVYINHLFLIYLYNTIYNCICQVFFYILNSFMGIILLIIVVKYYFIL